MYFLKKMILIFWISFFCHLHDAKARNLVFNLTGSFHGNGDVTAPLWLILEMKKKSASEDVFHVVIDERAKEILKMLFPEETLEQIEEKHQIFFCDQEKAKFLKKADYAFELNFGGRLIHHLTDLVYNDKNTVTFISDTMHGRTFDEIRREEKNSYLFFKPPGVGSHRSGIVYDPELDFFIKKTLLERRKELAVLFAKSGIGWFFVSSQWRDTKIGFIYGVNNEVISSEFVGQTKRYIENISKQHPRNPLVFFSPNEKADLKKALPGEKIYSLDEFKKITHPSHLGKTGKNRIVVSLGKISNKQFGALMSASDFPVLVEGNNAVCSALRLGKGFYIYRSPWNILQIEDLMSQDSDLYFKKARKELKGPLFFNSSLSSAENTCVSSFQGLGLANKFLYLMDFLENLKKIEEKRVSDAERKRTLLDLSRKVYDETKDEVLAYSLIYDAYKQNSDNPLFYAMIKEKREEFSLRGIDYKSLQRRFLPNWPNESLKIESLESIHSLTEAVSEVQQLRRMPVRSLLQDKKVQKYLKENKVYVSLTTSPARISRMRFVLDSLDLTFIDKILVCLPEVFARDGSRYVIPAWLLRYPRVKIVHVPQDLGPITKLLPAAEWIKKRGVSKALLITIDDDIGYPKGMISEMIFHHALFPETVWSGATEKPPHLRFPELNLSAFPGKKRKSTVDIVAGYAAIGYPLEKIDTVLLRSLSELSHACFLSDDLAVSFGLSLKGISKRLINNSFFHSGMLKIFDYGLKEDALHLGAGLMDVQNPSYANDEKYLSCYQSLIDDLLKKKRSSFMGRFLSNFF